MDSKLFHPILCTGTFIGCAFFFLSSSSWASIPVFRVGAFSLGLLLAAGLGIAVGAAGFLGITGDEGRPKLKNFLAGLAWSGNEVSLKP